MDLYTTREYIQENESISLFKVTVIDDIKWHEHEFVEIAYVVEGNGLHYTENGQEEVCDGDLILINAHSSHQYISSSNSPLQICNCIFEPHLIDSSFVNGDNFFNVAYQYLFHSFYSDSNAKNYIKLADSQRKIQVVLENMLYEYENKQNGYIQILKSELIKTLIMVFRLFVEETGKKKPIYNDLIVDITFNFLKDNYYKNIKCDDIAKQFYLSTGHFSRLFKKATGTTVVKTLQNIRINKACELLEETDKTVMEIANLVGYSDLKYFYTIFGNIKNLSPGEYRNTNSPNKCSYNP